MKIMQEKIVQLQCADKVKFHGFVNEPYSHIAKADVLVLPSLSEGIPRSALEALYLGIPCVLRDADGNSELIKQGINGFLFKNNTDLAQSMIKAVKISRNRNEVVSLLPTDFTQYKSAKKFLQLMELNK
jgi:glycosyltransferase involved in cell wall biosynthesis